MRETEITITVTDDHLRQAGFDPDGISDHDFEKVARSIGYGLKIALAQQAIKAKQDYWWLARLKD